MTPDTHTNQELFVEVGDGHELYVHDWGKGTGTPILFLHGGPGGGCDDSHKLHFDPTQQRVIFHDQRGAGKSTAEDVLKTNTIQTLTSDISVIADKLDIDRFALFGGSWGSLLALHYAVTHPERVAAILARGVFTGTYAEMDWLDKGMFRYSFPEVWQAYLSKTPPEHHNDPTAYHFDKITNGTPKERKLSAYAYCTMEYALYSLDDRYTIPDFDTFDPNSLNIEMHYMRNRCFLPDNYIPNHADKLTMPIRFVQGRYDMICAPFGAYNLAQKLPNCRLIWSVAGHSGSDRNTFDVMRNLGLELTRPETANP